MHATDFKQAIYTLAGMAAFIAFVLSIPGAMQ